MNLFRTGPVSNCLPFGVHFNPETNVSTLYDRLYRQLVCIPGKWPGCDLALAVPCDIDAPRLYGVKPIATFYREGCQVVVDPPVRARLR